MTITRHWQQHPEGIGAGRVRRHQGAVRGQRDRGGAALAQGLRAGLGDRRVRDAAAGDAHPQRPGVGQGPDRRPDARDLPADRPRRCGPASTCAALGENTIALDCDVLQADGGTRTAAITGAYVALADAVTWLRRRKALAGPEPLSCSVAAVSVGRRRRARPGSTCRTRRTSRAEVDMNVVCTGAGDVRRGAGHRRGRAVRPAHPGRACSTSRWPAARSSPSSQRARSRPRELPA